MSSTIFLSFWKIVCRTYSYIHIERKKQTRSFGRINDSYMSYRVRPSTRAIMRSSLYAVVPVQKTARFLYSIYFEAFGLKSVTINFISRERERYGSPLPYWHYSVWNCTCMCCNILLKYALINFDVSRCIVFLSWSSDFLGGF